MSYELGHAHVIGKVCLDSTSSQPKKTAHPSSGFVVYNFYKRIANPLERLSEQ